MIRTGLSLLMVGALAANAAPLTPPIAWSLAGEWQVHDASDAGFKGWRATDSRWQPLKVPANWYAAGKDHQGALWYQREFSLPPLTADQRVTLEFDGVDYFADVWLNGRKLRHHEGYFQRFSQDITAHLQRYNRLAVRVDSPLEDVHSNWPLRKNLMKGILNQHDSRPGGAWSAQGQDANSGGIWAPVRLRVSRAATIDALILRPDWSQGLAHPRLQAEIRYRAPVATEATLTLQATPDNFSGNAFHLSQRVSLQATGEQAQRLTVSLAMPQARLWWPVGAGKPHLYQVRAALRDDRGIMDRRSSRTGLRKIEERPDNQGWQINDTRIFIRGTNYIGSPWLSTMTKKRYERDFQLVEKMNANAIRVHGHVAGRALYEVADERGLLIWQDVPLQWGYNDSPEFADNAVRQTREMVEQFGNSPAIVVWGGQNEPPFNSPWMEKRFPDWNNNLNRNLTARVAETLAEDRSRLIHPFSAVEEHYWAGWYFGTLNNLLEPAKTATITEFGAQALPKLATLNTIIPPREQWPASTEPGDAMWTRWKYHNFQPIQTFKNAGIQRGKNIHTFIANTQRYQAQLVALAAESYRRQRYQPVTALFQFMFVETWPSINWGVVDYLRQPKEGYYALQRAYQPLLPSIDPHTTAWKTGQTGTLSLWVINDLQTAYPGSTLRWSVAQRKQIIAAGKQTLDIAADSGVKVTDVEAKPVDTSPLRVDVKIINADGLEVAKNQLILAVGK